MNQQINDPGNRQVRGTLIEKSTKDFANLAGERPPMYRDGRLIATFVVFQARLSKHPCCHGTSHLGQPALRGPPVMASIRNRNARSLR